MVPQFVFVVPMWDHETIDVINKYASPSPWAAPEIIKIHEDPYDGRRVWNKRRYEHMVHIRNLLLRRVKQINPEFFWSLDSDVLPREDSLVEALRVFGNYDCSAVGMHLYLSMNGRKNSSKGQLANGRLYAELYETELENSYPADVVMASVLMGPRAYKVDYCLDDQGEDVGWSKACKEKDVRFMWAGKALCKHVYKPELLNEIDKRVGF